MRSHPDHQAPAAGLAGIVCDLVTRPPAGSGHVGGEDRAEVAAITQAMIRLLLGAPLRSDGKLTVKSLAEEAGLTRNKLTHKHPGLKDLFYALVKAQNSRPEIAADLHRMNDELRQTVEELRQQRAELHEAVRQLARVVHVLEVENQHLRDRVGATSAVTSLRDRPRATKAT
jgi:AcrR family transcriptional regulator